MVLPLSGLVACRRICFPARVLARGSVMVAELRGVIDEENKAGAGAGDGVAVDQGGGIHGVGIGERRAASRRPLRMDRWRLVDQSHPQRRWRRWLPPRRWARLVRWRRAALEHPQRRWRLSGRLVPDRLRGRWRRSAPVIPATPVAPAGPVAPVGPTGPVGPVGPVAPVTPGVPGAPVGPVGPTAPVNPGAPEKTTSRVAGWLVETLSLLSRNAVVPPLAARKKPVLGAPFNQERT